MPISLRALPGMRSRHQQLIKIAAPAILENIVSVMITSIDAKMIAPLGKTAVSAVSLTTQPKLFFLSVFYALGTTTSIFVSQALGKKNQDEANEYFHTVLRMCLISSVILMAGLALFAAPVMRLFSRQRETLELSVSFFRIVMGLMIFQNVSIVLNAALRGIGETRVTFLCSVAMGAVDILTNYLLIEGHWGFPRLEVKGDAIGTVAGTVAACAVSFIYLTRHSDFLSLKGFWSRKRKGPETVKAIRLKFGNVLFENIFTRIGFLVSSVIVSGLPAGDTAVYFVAMILLNYTFAFGDGLQSAIVSITGQSMGAGKPHETRDSVRYGRSIGLGMAVALSAVYILGGRWFMGQYFTDEASLARGVQYSYVVASLTVLQILRMVNIAAMRGIGEVKIPRVMATVCVMIINPAAGFLLAEVFGFGIWGIWMASLITQIAWYLMSLVKANACIGNLQTPQAEGC